MGVNITRQQIPTALDVPNGEQVVADLFAQPVNVDLGSRGVQGHVVWRDVLNDAFFGNDLSRALKQYL
jgi:hypothetical protein